MIKTVRSRPRFPKFNKNSFEHEAWASQHLVCGIDEVGRGCLAGPVVTAAVILPCNKTSTLLKDSKILNENERLAGYRWVTKHCWYAFGIVDHRLVDQHNVWQATLIAMKKALVHLLSFSPRPCAILVDAMPVTLLDTSYFDIPVHHFPFGEHKSSSIAAASIIAKVKRDNLMRTMDRLFPGYALADHKGYSTKEHKELLAQHEPLIIHRQTYLKNLALGAQDEQSEQQTLC